MSEDEVFYSKWTLTRKKGKFNYILLRGFLYWIIIYTVWVAVTLIFDKNKFNADTFQLRFIYWGILYLISGFVISYCSWKNQDKRYNNLKQYLGK